MNKVITNEEVKRGWTCSSAKVRCLATPCQRKGDTKMRYDHSPMVASLKTMSKLVSSIHLILKPPLAFSHSENATWMSLVLSSFGNPVRERIRVTHAESCESEDAIAERCMRAVVWKGVRG